MQHILSMMGKVMSPHITAPHVMAPRTPMPAQGPTQQGDSHAFRMLLAQHLMNALQMKQAGGGQTRNPMNPTGTMP